MESTGSILVLMMSSKRAHAKGHLPGLLLSAPNPTASHCQPSNITIDLVQSTMGSLFFPLGHGAHKILFVPSKNGDSVSPSPVEVLQSNPTGLQSQISWGLLIPLLDPQAWKPDRELRTITTVGELLWHYCFPVNGLPTQWAFYFKIPQWDFILL